MTENTAVSSARVAFLKSRLHTAKTGICRCGACRHQIEGAAHAWEVPAEDVLSRITDEAETLPTTPAAPARVASRLHLTGQVGANATVTVDGRRVSALEGLLAAVDLVRSA